MRFVSIAALNRLRAVKISFMQLMVPMVEMVVP